MPARIHLQFTLQAKTYFTLANKWITSGTYPPRPRPMPMKGIYGGTVEPLKGILTLN